MTANKRVSSISGRMVCYGLQLCISLVPSSSFNLQIYLFVGVCVCVYRIYSSCVHACEILRTLFIFECVCVCVFVWWDGMTLRGSTSDQSLLGSTQARCRSRSRYLRKCLNCWFDASLRSCATFRPAPGLRHTRAKTPNSLANLTSPPVYK